MVDASRDFLRHHYLLVYDELKARLTQRLGSAELARDALHDTWLRLETSSPAAPVDRPYPYLLRVALNLGLRSAQRARRTLTLDDAKAALNLVDDAPSPAQIYEARAELEMLKQAIKELTPRRREILLAARLQGLSMSDVAARHGISQRMAERELKSALTHCAERLGKKLIRRFGPRLREVSHKGTKE
ncbi:MAG: sigma-70 family RNA polymerase sigma factor [Pseudomonadota bacterium]